MKSYSQDYLLDKRIKIYQPITGYRASTDAILISSVISNIKAGDKILDVGSGTGAISLCLAERFKNMCPQIIGIEIQEELCCLANQSSQTNNFATFLKYIQGNICEFHQELPNCSFQHVVTNPPYSEHDMPSPNPSKAIAHNHHGIGLKQWLEYCIKMTAPKGHIYVIHRTEAISEILAIYHEKKLGNINIIPIYSKVRQKAKRIIVIATKDSKAPTCIHPGIILHDLNGAYTPEANKILRKGLAFQLN